MHFVNYLIPLPLAPPKHDVMSRLRYGYWRLDLHLAQYQQYVSSWMLDQPQLTHCLAYKPQYYSIAAAWVAIPELIALQSHFVMESLSLLLRHRVRVILQSLPW